MRVAVALSGEMRGCTKSIELLLAHVIQPFKDAGATVDLFIHTRKDPWWLPASGLDFRGLWVEENRPRDDSIIVSAANPRHKGDNPTTDQRRGFLYQSYLQQYESLYAAGQMVYRAERQDGVLYDWVVRSRPDCYLEAPLPVKDLQADTLNVPWNDWWPYEVDGVRWDTVTDKFAVGPSRIMGVYFDKLFDLQSFCARYRLQGEAFTVWQLNQHGHSHIRHEGMKIHQSDLKYKYSLRPDHK